MKTRNFALTISLLAMILMISSCTSAASNPPPVSTPASTTALDGASLVQERCAVCHPLTFVEKSRHTAADWKLIVDLMISRGAQLSPNEKTSVVNYLSANFGQ
jgi:hypothetical protein